MDTSINAGILPASLIDILDNSLILKQLTPYIPIASRLALAATSKTICHILQSSPETYRYVDLSAWQSARVPDMAVDRGGVNWRSQRMDEALTEDDVYCGPLRGIFSRLAKRNALRSIHILILDGLTVPADLVAEIINDTNVQILSIRQARQLNQRKLMQVLKYACRPTRAQHTPRLKGLYVFGPKDSTNALIRTASPSTLGEGSARESQPEGVMESDGAQIGASWNKRSQDALNTPIVPFNPWYSPIGRMITKSEFLSEWAETLKACEGIIFFDAVLCRGPRHDITKYSAGAAQHLGSNESWLPPAVADITLGPKGCVQCGTATEGAAVHSVSPAEHLPLISPSPLHSSSIHAAQRPDGAFSASFPRLFARCSECLTGRWCERCNKWWDEQCYPSALTGSRISEVRNAATALDQRRKDKPKRTKDVRVFLGLCIESCLVSEEMNGSGSGGMWG